MVSSISAESARKSRDNMQGERRSERRVTCKGAFVGWVPATQGLLPTVLARHPAVPVWPVNEPLGCTLVRVRFARKFPLTVLGQKNVENFCAVLFFYCAKRLRACHSFTHGLWVLRRGYFAIDPGGAWPFLSQEISAGVSTGVVWLRKQAKQLVAVCVVVGTVSCLRAPSPRPAFSRARSAARCPLIRRPAGSPGSDGWSPPVAA
jgi:hypothetical protein